MPPFDLVKPEHFRPAFDQVLKEHTEKIASIASNTEDATFDNTIKALDSSFLIKSKISSLFGNLCSSLSSPELQKVQSEMAPILAVHSSSVYMFDGLFDRIDTVYKNRLNGIESLTPEEIRVTGE